MVLNYAQGRVYWIRSHNDPELVYYGSTTQSLSQRLAGHKREYIRWKNGKGSWVTSFRVLEAGAVYIELVERVNASSKEELTAREGKYIRDNECVNKVIPGRTRAEYHAEHKEELNARYRQYRADHLDELKAKDREYHAEHREERNAKSKLYYMNNRREALEEKKGYYIDKKDLILAQRKDHYRKNTENVKARTQAYRAQHRDTLHQKYSCECGGRYIYTSKSRHNKTKHHILWVESQTKVEVENKDNEKCDDNTETFQAEEAKLSQVEMA